MTTVTEIEAAIERLPSEKVEELAVWLQSFLARRASSSGVDEWLNRARGTAIVGVTTDEILALTRDAQ